MKFDISDLNEGQKEAYDLLCNFINDKTGDEMFVLSGFAGTGKTYLVNKVIRYIRNTHPNYKIALTAPTNKAVKVLRRAAMRDKNHVRDSKVEFQTIHRLLGLTEEITKSGEQIFTRKDYSKNSVKYYKVLVVDEVSMLDDSLFNELELYSDNVKIIFMGDPAQIPPVGRPDCIPFRDDVSDKYKFIKYQLSKIERQGLDNPIVSLGFEIRSNLEAYDPIGNFRKTSFVEGSDHLGIDLINTSLASERDRGMQLLHDMFCSDEFKRDADYAKVLAWRNKTIDKMNEILRTMIYGQDKHKIMVGEKLVANKPIMDELTNSILFNTNDEFEVKSFTIDQMPCATSHEAITVKFYNTLVQYETPDDEIDEIEIPILHESSISAFNKAANFLKEIAISTKGKDRSWLKYYSFLRQFADVNYNYAITCHKAQGSTYKNVFVIEDDMDENRNIVERNRIKYTAVTRPSDKLFLMKRV